MENDAFYQLMEKVLEQQEKTNSLILTVSKRLEEFYNIFQYVEKYRRKKEREKEPSLNDIRTLMTEVSNRTNENAVYQLLRSFGVSNISHLKPDELGEFVERLNEL